MLTFQDSTCFLRETETCNNPPTRKHKIRVKAIKQVSSSVCPSYAVESRMVLGQVMEISMEASKYYVEFHYFDYLRMEKLHTQGISEKKLPDRKLPIFMTATHLRPEQSKLILFRDIRKTNLTFCYIARLNITKMGLIFSPQATEQGVHSLHSESTQSTGKFCSLAAERLSIWVCTRGAVVIGC